MKVQPVKRKRKQLKIKYISNDDIPQYFEDDGQSMDDHQRESSQSEHSRDVSEVS